CLFRAPGLEHQRQQTEAEQQGHGPTERCGYHRRATYQSQLSIGNLRRNSSLCNGRLWRRSIRVNMRLRTSILLPALLVSGLTTACQKQEHDPSLAAAFEEFASAIRAQDAGRLWDLSPAELHDRLDTLYEELSDVIDSVKNQYPQSDREAALQNLAADRVAGVTSGKELFIAFLALDALSTSPAVARGLEIESTRLTGPEGTVITRGGETFLFVREGDGWRCTSLLAQFESFPSLRTLRANMQTAKSNIETWSKATAETTDRTKPAGTLNVLARASRRQARVMVFQLLDKASKEQLAAGAKAASEFKAELAKRIPSADARKKYLVDRKMSWLLRVGTPKSLFVELWDAEVFAKMVPTLDAFEIDEVVTVSEDLARVKVTFADQKREFEFKRELSVWFFSSLEPAIVASGIARLTREQRALSTAQ
ncbi:MAG: hypothetical protein ACI9OJ_003115, partial [Myxococcota bacterium]